MFSWNMQSSLGLSRSLTIRSLSLISLIIVRGHKSEGSVMVIEDKWNERMDFNDVILSLAWGFEMFNHFCNSLYKIIHVLVSLGI